MLPWILMTVFSFMYMFICFCSLSFVFFLKKNVHVVNTALTELFLIFSRANKGNELQLPADVLFFSRPNSAGCQELGCSPSSPGSTDWSLNPSLCGSSNE